MIGKSKVKEYYSYNKNISKLFEDIYRFIESENPNEIIINTKLKYYDVDDIKRRLSIENRSYYFNKGLDIDKSIYNISYQEQFLEKIFSNSSMLTSIENLDLENMNYGRISYIILLKFSYEHDSDILQKIKKPEINNESDNLILSNNTLYQLNIIDNTKTPNIKSLYDILNKTKTLLGKRLLKNNILNPISNIKILNQRYHDIESILDIDINTYLSSQLKLIVDIERYSHRVYTNKLNPHEFYNFYKSLDVISHTFEYLSENNKFNTFNLKKSCSSIKKLIKDIEKVIDIEKIQKYTLLNIEECIFIKGYSKEIDKLQFNIDTILGEFNNEIKYLSNLIEEDKDYLKIEKTEKSGYYYSVSKGRGKVLEKKVNDYTFKYNTSNVKITSKNIDSKSDKLLISYEKLKNLNREVFCKYLKDILNINNDLINNIIEAIAYIDFINSGSTVSLLYDYTKPNINMNKTTSYFNAKNIRHPIIERLSIKQKYVLNDISLGESNDGTLLFSINGAGKSSLMKAVGLNIVLAQMGYFVPSSEFNFYPFKTIFTRIMGNDNIFKGHSSFTVEMNELRTIIKNGDENSLVLGDEVCKGTEDISALSIVSAAVEMFAERKVKFIFATHLHKIIELNLTEKYKNININHLEVDINDNGIVYIRKLKDGSGSSLYGIEVANFIINDDIFMKKANKIRNNLLNKSENIVECNKSRYNNNIYLDNCTICKKTKKELGNNNLHVHHIVFQEDFKNNNVQAINGTRKNDRNNLVVLCDEHHKMVHNNKLEITGYMNTNKGTELVYNFT